MPARKPKTKMPVRVLRWPAVLEFSGLSDTQLREKIKQGEFPAPFDLSDSGRAQGWLDTELMEWLRNRIAARDNA